MVCNYNRKINNQISEEIMGHLFKRHTIEIF